MSSDEPPRPAGPGRVCPADGPAPPTCDDGAFGKGTGGQLRWQVRLVRNEPTTLWFAVAGSDQGVAAARAELTKALADPEAALAQGRLRQQIAANTQVDLPGDPLLENSIAWSKQNLADSVQEVHDLQLRPVEEGRVYPASEGTLAKARWLGAGWPDYPWLFGTDGEYAFASVAMGQFAEIKSHLRALRDVSEVVNGNSGKVVHEVMPDGSIYYGTLDSAGNTDETSKFPSAVALIWRWTGDDGFRDDLYPFTVRNMRYVVEQLDDDEDGWPEGLGNVERSGMGVEKFDNTVYTIRGLRDLADLAGSKGDDATMTWATEHAAAMEAAFEAAWWYGGDADQYADSIDDPANPANDNTKILQRHWIGVTPMDAEIVRPGERRARWQPTRTASSRWRSGRSRATQASSGCTTPGQAPRRPPAVTGDRRATAWCRRCRASGRSSRSTPESWPSRRGTSVAWVRTSSSGTPRAMLESSSTRESGRCRVPCRRSRRARTSRPTSSVRSTTGPWCCRHGAHTGRCGLWCTTSSASAPISDAAISRSSLRCPTVSNGSPAATSGWGPGR